MSLLLNLNEMKDEAISLQGDLPVSDLAMESLDDMIRCPEKLRYDLLAQHLGNDILVQGRLALTLSCTCVRCLREFNHPVVLPDWTCDVHIEGADAVIVQGDCVDLTPYVREDIFLAFPQHPLCEARCAGLRNAQQDDVPRSVGGLRRSGVPSPWDALNKLKI